MISKFIIIYIYAIGLIIFSCDIQAFEVINAFFENDNDHNIADRSFIRRDDGNTNEMASNDKSMIDTSHLDAKNSINRNLAQKGKTNNAFSDEPDVIYMETYKVNSRSYYCVHKLYSSIDLFTCVTPPPEDQTTSDPPFGNGKDEPIIIVPDGTDWKLYCGSECLKHSLTFNGWPCVGYSYDSQIKKCVLKRCEPGSPESTMSGKGKKVIEQYVSIGDSCALEMEGTKSPSKRIKPTVAPTLKPTKSPTVPTKLRTQAPVINDGFVSPSNIPRSYPVKWELYLTSQTPVELFSEVCEIITTRPGTFFRRYDNWLGNLDDCVKECSYDSGCRFALYGAKAKTCIKALDCYIIDDDTRISAWISGEWVAYAKTSRVGVVPYVAGYCSNYRSPTECNSDDLCKWNKGRRGENQMAEWTGGFCGRVKCSAIPNV